MELTDRFARLMSETLHCASTPEGLALPLEEIQTRLLRVAEQERLTPVALRGRAEDSLADAGGERTWQKQLELARLAVYAWVDETMLHAARPDAAAWMPLGLQCHYFATSEAGHLFYVRLDEVLDGLGLARQREGTPLSLDRRLEQAAQVPLDTPGRTVLHVFALCLLYGFTGQHYDQPQLLACLRKASYGLLPRYQEPVQNNGPATAVASRVLFSRLEACTYVLIPLVVCVLFALYCAAMLANVPIRGL